MKKIILALVAIFTFSALSAAEPEPVNPVAQLVDRIHKGASKKFIFELTDQQSEEDFFELSSKGSKIIVKGNNYISVAAGLNWYLKYYAGVNITWNSPHANLNMRMPQIPVPERHSTDILLRYYLSYPSYSFSTAFWSWQRWQQEIDWMVLHGINLPLSIDGTATIWRNTLLALGYPREDINQYMAGPAHQAWFLRGEIESLGGPAPDSWYDSQVRLQELIIDSYITWGIEPVLAGFSGMMPADSYEKLGITVKDGGKWHGFQRAAYIDPADPKFAEVAQAYYKESEKLFGKVKYYSTDPFYAASEKNVAVQAQTGKAVKDALKKFNPQAVWVITGDGDYPAAAMTDNLAQGDVLILNAQSNYAELSDRYGHHEWIYCMPGNRSGRTGMFGKMQQTIDGYYAARTREAGRNMVGIGTVVGGVGYNPVMHELLYELPWRSEKFSKTDWIAKWPKAHYGNHLPEIIDAWQLLSNSVYEAPQEWLYAGAAQPVSCARPALVVDNVTFDGSTKIYYSDELLVEALGKFVNVSEKYRGCNNFEFDIVDLARQALSDRMFKLLGEIERAFDNSDTEQFKKLSDTFLVMIKMQDALLSSRTEFMVGPWIESAMQSGRFNSEADFLRWNARMLITTWSESPTFLQSEMVDYGYREWSGLLSDYYYPRWKQFFDNINEGQSLISSAPDIDSKWAADTNPYPINPVMDAINMSREVYELLVKR